MAIIDQGPGMPMKDNLKQFGLNIFNDLSGTYHVYDPKFGWFYTPESKSAQKLKIEVISGGYWDSNKAEISINGEVQTMNRHEGYQAKGLHLVVLNPQNGLPILKESFDI